MKMRRIAVAAALASALLGSAPEALAHKMRLFATVERVTEGTAKGTMVSGYVYFSPGGRAQDVLVTAATAGGTPVFQGRTDDRGEFRFEARRQADHVIDADGGDGHKAGFTIKAAELPDSLPGSAPAPSLQTVATGLAVATATAPAPPISSDLAALVEQSVARQVRPLREQLDAYEETIRWHDVLGGLGTIIGFAGLAYGLATRSQGRQRRHATAGKEETAR